MATPSPGRGAWHPKVSLLGAGLCALSLVASTGLAGLVASPAEASALPPTGATVTITPPTAPDVFIADSGNGRILKVPAGGGAQTTVASGLNTPEGVAVDAAGDVFIADTANNSVVEVPAGGGAQTTVASGLNTPEGVAVDAAGDVFIADTANN
ncbi:MAG: NHL repeat-containing protein, partial [Acidimicrobiales bacterium]